MMDVPFELDARVVNRTWATAEVVAVFFPWLGKALIVDMRHRDDVPPAIFADDMAGSVAERLRRLARRRPQFTRPPRLAPLPWPAGVGSFLDSGAYEQVVRRCYQLGYGRLEADFRRALSELQQAEREIKIAYIRDTGCRTLYQRQPAG